MKSQNLISPNHKQQKYLTIFIRMDAKLIKKIRIATTIFFHAF